MRVARVVIMILIGVICLWSYISNVAKADEYNAQVPLGDSEFDSMPKPKFIKYLVTAAIFEVLVYFGFMLFM